VAHVTRRTLVLSVATVLITGSRRAAAQPAQRVFRIGVLSPGTPPPGPLNALSQGFRELGYEDGRNISIEWRFSGTTDERLRDLAEELVRLKVDVIVSINTQASLAAKQATATTPIVIARVSDPVRTGLVSSFAHPGGNVTGLSGFSDELSGKRLALIRELMPTLSRLAVLWNAGNPGIELSVKEMARAGTKLGIELHLHGMKSAEDLRPIFEGVSRERVGALFVFDDVLVATYKTQILTWAAKARLPVLSQYAEIPEAGGLMSYGPNIPEIYRRAAIYVDKILKGAKPADLPVEQPTKLELVLNLKCAKTLSVKIPDSILLRADRVLE
jgi:putative ABC transport system substrate-binding protein